MTVRSSRAQCPDSETLGALAEGRLRGTARTSAIEHVADCADCAAEVAMLAELADRTGAGTSGRSSWWWLAAAAIVLIGAGALLVMQWQRPQSPVAPLVAATEPLSYRLTEARLTGGFAWAEYRGPVRSNETARDPLRLQVAGAAGDALQDADRDSAAGTRHAAGIAALLIEDRGGAVERLTRVVAERPDDARAWNDLAAARYEAAIHLSRASQLPEALAATDRALELEPAMAEALFNRALIVERLGLVAEARDAWQQYLAVDAGSSWAIEARKRLAALPKSAKPSRDRARMEVEVLGAWGASELAGDAGKATLHLTEARAAAAALTARGEHLLADAVDAIDRASGEDRQRLAAAHVSYRTGRQALARRDAAAAERELRRAAGLFGDRSHAGALLARYYLASAAYVADRIADAERELVALRRDPHLASSYKALHAQLAWQYGLIQARLARWPAAIAEYRTARSLFSELDEHLEAAFLDALIAEAAAFLGRSDMAWERWCGALRTLSVLDLDDRLAVTLGTAARTEWIAGRGAAARSLLAIEIRRGATSPAVRADALLRNAVVSARMQRPDVAMGALQEAERATTSIVDAGARAAMAADLRVAEGIAVAASDPERALRALTAAIDEYRSDRRLLLPAALFERGRLLRALGRSDEAAVDLRAAVDAIEEQRDEIDWRDIRAGALTGAGDIYTTLVELLLEQGAAHDAFTIADRAAAHAFYGSAGAASRIAPTALQRRLATDERIVTYALLPRELVAFVLDAQRLEVRRVPAAPSAVIERAALLDAAMRERREPNAVRRASAALHDLLVAPLRDDLATAHAITFVPPPELMATPFAALFDGRTGRWLIEDHAVRIAPTALLETAPPTERRPRVVVVRPSAGNAPLPRAADEAAVVMQQHPGAKLIEGDDASTTTVLAAIASATLVHYAGHADSERDAGLVLRSSADGDELLYAADVERARLAAAPLVVLAGCRTSRGGMRADPLSGSLARAFLLAGAAEVIGTAWDVGDDAAGDLFAELHRGLAASNDVDAALRNAQLTMLANRSRHVADWAAAQLVVRSAAAPRTNEREA